MALSARHHGLMTRSVRNPRHLPGGVLNGKGGWPSRAVRLRHEEDALALKRAIVIMLEWEYDRAGWQTIGRGRPAYYPRTTCSGLHIASPPGHAVVGLLADRHHLGVRFYQVAPNDRAALVRLLIERLPSSLALADLDEPQCLAHDDCAALLELGRACFRDAHGPKP